jgi:3-hydroxyisobutyrate dehydrogenase-like beta-hydroxyacid dehydrogenase
VLISNQSRKHDNPTFSNRLMLKDVKLAIETAENSGLDHSSADGIQSIIQHSIDLGWSEDDISG